MTPKQKAKQLINKHRKIDSVHAGLVTAGEVIASFREIFGRDEAKQPDIAFWMEVEKELKKKYQTTK